MRTFYASIRDRQATAKSARKTSWSPCQPRQDSIAHASTRRGDALGTGRGMERTDAVGGRVTWEREGGVEPDMARTGHRRQGRSTRSRRWRLELRLRAQLAPCPPSPSSLQEAGQRRARMRVYGHYLNAPARDLRLSPPRARAQWPPDAVEYIAFYPAPPPPAHVDLPAPPPSSCLPVLSPLSSTAHGFFPGLAVARGLQVSVFVVISLGHTS